MFKIIGAVILFMTFPAFGRPISLLFGDLKKMPYAWDAPALDALTFNEAVFGRLINVDADFRLKPGLLKRFYFDQKLNGYVLELSPQLEFSNGRLVKANDLEFSILRGFFSPQNNFFRVYFSNIEGIGAIKAGTEYKTGMVSGIKKLDDSRLLVKLSTPNPSFLHSLSNMVIRLVPREELTKDLFTWKGLPVGAGPYFVVSVDEKIYSVRIRSKTESSREFEFKYAKDHKPADISFVEETGYIARRFTRPSVVRSVFFSNKTALGTDFKFRKSFAAAFNPNPPTLANLQVAHELLPATFWGRSTPQKTDPEVQKFDGRSVSARILNFSANPSPAIQALRHAIQSTLSKLKAKSNVAYTRSKFLTDQGDETADIFGFGILADYFDPLLMFNTFGPESPLKSVALTGDEKFMSLIKKARSAENFEERTHSIQALSQYVIDQAYAVPIYYEYAIAYYNPKTISAVGELDVPNLIHLEQVKMKE